MELAFVKIASIIKTHGYRGSLVLKIDNNISFSQLNKCLKEGNAIFISKDGIPVPFFISVNTLDFIDEKVIQLKLDDLNDMENAKAYINNDVYMPSGCIETEPDNKLSPDSWVGFKVIDKSHGFVGVVVGFSEEIPQNPLLIIENKGKELMIPLNGNLVSSIEMGVEEILTNLPEGYLDLFS